MADGFFMIDIIFNFLTVLDDDYNEIDDMKIIARNYFFGWFLIDLVATFPIELVL